METNQSINQSTIVWRTRNRNGILFGIKQHCDLKIQLNVNLVQVLRDQNFRYFKIFEFSYLVRGRCSRDRMVVGFTTTYAIIAHHHWCCEFESRSGRGVQHYVIKFVNVLQQVCGFLLVLRLPPPIKLTTTIWLKYFWKWR